MMMIMIVMIIKMIIMDDEGAFSGTESMAALAVS